MLGAYVCRQCRTRFPRRATLVRNPQWQPRATFQSLRSSEPQHAAKPAQDEASPTMQEQQPPVQRMIHDEPNKEFTNPSYRTAQRSRYSGLVDDNTVAIPSYTEDGYTEDGYAEDGYIEDGYIEGAQEDVHEEARPKKASEYAQAYYFPISRALSRNNVRGAWESFERIYTGKDCNALSEHIEHDDWLKQARLLPRLLENITRDFCSGKSRANVGPAAVLFRYQQLGIARNEHWVRPALELLTQEVIRAVNALSKRPLEHLHLMLHELISLWRLFFQCMGPHGNTSESINTKWPLPSVEELPDLYDYRDFNRRLQGYIPKYVSSPALGFCAVYMYSISDALEPTLREEAVPFLAFIEKLLAGSHVDTIFKYTKTSGRFSELPDDVQRQIIEEINMAPRKAMVAVGTEGDNPDEMTNLEMFHNKRIARAIQTTASPMKLEQLWEEVKEAYTAADKTVTIPRSIYNHFLSGYLTLFWPQRAVEVWNHMIAHKVEPDVQSWVALMEGCAKTNDIDGFNATWKRMQSAGVEPENFAWTTRIHGLMSLRQVNQALAALDDLGKRWLAAEDAMNNKQKRGKGQKAASKVPGTGVKNCIKPSIEVVNGAVSAIAQMRDQHMRHERRVEFVQKILTWAKTFQIKPNAITYNSLIQLYLRAKDTATALRILGQLEREGLEGDIATHTMLISAAFENQIFNSQSEQEQTEKVLKVLDDLEGSGLKLNAYVYSTVIDRLLKSYANYNAVRSIMDHMLSRKFIPSVHVYTSLITHYFQSEPPKLAEVDSIVNLLFTSSHVASDRMLYDRLIEGYASHGEIGKMMSVLTRMSKQGKLPGWSALIAVVKALVQEGDYERARIVVRDVARGEGVASGGIMGDRMGQWYFKKTVESLGLGLDEEKMADFMRGETDWNGERAVDQMMPREQQPLPPAPPPPPPPPPHTEYPRDALAMNQDIHGFLADHQDPTPDK